MATKDKMPEFFKDKEVIDCGSRDINGSLLEYFQNCIYLGVDIERGKNVHLKSLIHELPFRKKFDVVTSAEMLEHSEFWQKDLLKMYDMLKENGLLIISCASEGRTEHGTVNFPEEYFYGTSQTYYRNISKQDVLSTYGDMDKKFSSWELTYNPDHCDLYFWGVKNGKIKEDY